MEHSQTAHKQSLTFTDQMRILFKDILNFFGKLFNRLGIPPNTMTMIGLLGNVIGAIFLARGQFLTGGLLILASGPFDALDGTMARLLGNPSEFGAFVDSVTDRYSELVIYGGLLLFAVQNNQLIHAVLVFLAASGSVLVSYVRAKAEALGFEAKVGVLTRLERYLVLAPSLVLGFPWIGVSIIALFANFTALQRIWFVRRQANSPN